MQLNMQNLIFNGKECRVLTCRDVTQVDRAAKLDLENKHLELLGSSFSHDLISPLKYIITFCVELLEKNQTNI